MPRSAPGRLSTAGRPWVRLEAARRQNADTSERRRFDLESIHALNVAWQRFEGTVLLVTHDQDLMEEVGTRIWHFDRAGIHDVKGTYEEFSGTLA